MSQATQARIPFPLGRLSITRNAEDDEVLEALRRHQRGDWGDVCNEDAKANDQALKYGDRLFSVYHTEEPETIKFYIITEWDRSYTTILLPEGY
jgi:predicted RNA-binding protein with PUA-like domain